MSLDSWRQNFDQADDGRMMRLGELVEPVVESAKAHKLRADLRTALLARLSQVPPASAPIGEWAGSGEELADEKAWAAEDQGDDAGYVRHFNEARSFGAVREIAADVTDPVAVVGAMYELFHSLDSSTDAVFELLARAPGAWPGLVQAAGQR